MFSIRLYIAENDETINLVEGERVIVLGMRKFFFNSVICKHDSVFRVGAAILAEFVNLFFSF